MNIFFSANKDAERPTAASLIQLDIFNLETFSAICVPTKNTYFTWEVRRSSSLIVATETHILSQTRCFSNLNQVVFVPKLKQSVSTALW